jgi:raffinose/stachyose/melibiose transport system permease protein
MTDVIEIASAPSPALRRRRPLGRSFNVSTTALYVFLTLYCLLNLFPVLWLVLSSFKSNAEIYENILSMPKEWEFSNYLKAWEAGQIGQYMLNSTFVTVPTLFLVLLFGSMAAYVLARVMPNNFLYSYFTLGIIVPVHVILIPTFILIRTLNLTNSHLSLILLYTATNLPLAVFILVGFMRSIPHELEEAATMDGASLVHIFFQIILPISRPGLAIVGTLTFLYCWNEYLFALVMISRRELKTLPQGIYSLRGEWTTDYGILTSGLVLSIIPVIIVYVLFQEQFIKGATAGSTVG